MGAACRGVRQNARVSSFLAGDGILIEIDPETLRERATDPEALRRWCAEHPADPRTVALLRILGELPAAERLGRQVLADPQLHPVTRAVRRARYAHVLQWQGRFEEADAEFSRACEETGLTEDPTSASSILALASVLQHRAKNRWEQAADEAARGRPRAAARLLEAAREDARRALGIREALGAPPDQRESARETVQRLDRDPALPEVGADPRA